MQLPDEKRLPNKVCGVCVKTLLHTIQFRELIIESQDTLLTGIPLPVTIPLSSTGKEVKCIEPEPLKTLEEPITFELSNDEITSARKDYSKQEKILEEPITLVHFDNELSLISEETSKNEETLEVPMDDFTNEQFDDDFVAFSSLSDNSLSSVDMQNQSIKIVVSAESEEKTIETKPKRKYKTRKRTKPLRIRVEGVRRSVVMRQAHDITDEMFALEDQMIEMKLFTCKECELDMKTFWDLREHVKKTHDLKRYLLCCDITLRVTTPVIYDHFRWHKDKSCFTCKDCGKELNSTDSFKRHHMMTHRKDIRCHVCEICGTGFTSISRLRLHLLKHETTNCPQCDKSEYYFK